MNIKFFLFFLLIFLNFSCQENLSTVSEQYSPLPLGESSQSLVPVTTEESRKKILLAINQQAKILNLCDGEIDENTYQNMSSVYPLEKQKYLVEFLCFFGAYQGNYQYFIYDNTQTNKIMPVNLEVYEVSESGEINHQQVTLIAGLPDYNSEQKILTLVTKYRGLGDCGTLAKYQWQENKFNLLEYRVKEKCDGVYLEPEQYSRIYP